MKKIVETSNAPAPIGPYNQAIRAGNMLFTSGQIAIDPKTGELVTSSIEAEANLVMKNLKAVLDEAGFTFENVVKSSIFLSRMELFNKVNEIYGAYFDPKTAPARETVAVQTLPKHVNVEISVIAIKS
ncbi:RidA family protein [Gangjinia marincola]|uniref:RidA family protein n=1 Tax=Gangjinia marincola TaxID=578463 RepID=A0ABN1MD54_9FLAO